MAIANQPLTLSVASEGRHPDVPPCAELALRHNRKTPKATVRFFTGSPGTSQPLVDQSPTFACAGRKQLFAVTWEKHSLSGQSSIHAVPVRDRHGTNSERLKSYRITAPLEHDA